MEHRLSQPTLLEPAAVATALRDSRRGGAAGLSGTRVEHLKMVTLAVSSEAALTTTPAQRSPRCTVRAPRPTSGRAPQVGDIVRTAENAGAWLAAVPGEAAPQRCAFQPPWPGRGAFFFRVKEGLLGDTATLACDSFFLASNI